MCVSWQSQQQPKPQGGALGTEEVACCWYYVCHVRGTVNLISTCNQLSGYKNSPAHRFAVRDSLVRFMTLANMKYHFLFLSITVRGLAGFSC